MARPSSYDPKYCSIAKKMCELGATDREVAEALDVSEVTLNAWKHKYPDFLKSLKLGKDPADERVRKSLYRRATGYSFDALKIFQYEGKEVCVPYVEHVPPDTTACIFWLKNRQPAEWRDRQELTGPDGGAIKIERIVREIE